jgi:hypothetical protein
VYFTYDDVAPQLSTPETNSTEAGGAALINSSVSDDMGLSCCWFEHNNTGTFQNASYTPLSGMSAACNLTLVLNDTLTTVHVRTWANDTSNNLNSSSYLIISTTDTAAPTITWINPSEGQAFPAGTASVTLNISSDEPMDWCAFEVSGTNHTGNISGLYCSYSLAVSDGNNYQAKAWANDTVGNLGSSSVRSFSVGSPPPSGGVGGGGPPPKTANVTLPNTVCSGENMSVVVDCDGCDVEDEVRRFEYYFNDDLVFQRISYPFALPTADLGIGKHTVYFRIDFSGFQDISGKHVFEVIECIVAEIAVQTNETNETTLEATPTPTTPTPTTPPPTALPSATPAPTPAPLPVVKMAIALIVITVAAVVAYAFIRKKKGMRKRSKSFNSFK